ncbi:phosphatidate cytidylyltransferase [Paraburkholderia sp. UCT31]|uniref:phosphatidate cytidylyltransferase n=1 Tax=Paraburkholderia sp. UCT31 TaxID=2615209 RepID=UPI0016564100|nr:phosphatidate cytidylyltransferase [Paraburkholderia sp. UCT31]MBC8737117.1 phosphatidate cytidylyltransferase [Paraburkholderia sp. UCT31]
MPHIFWATINGIAILLAVSTGIGQVLRLKFGVGNSTILNLNQRIFAWWAMVAVATVAIGAGPYATVGLFALISFFAFREFITLTPTKAADYSSLLLAFYVALPAQFILLAMRWYGLFAIFIPVYAFFVMSAAGALAQDTTEFLERNAKIQWALMVCVYGLSHAPALLMLEIPNYFSNNGPLLLFFLLVVQSSDVFQYVCGKLWGRHKLSPAVSPSKTVEGLLGGGAMAVLLGAVLHGLTPFSLWQAAAMSLVTVAAGFIGGLVLSGVKRSLGAKDWGVMLAGHGGMLDRVDSICFAAPIFFHLTRYFFVP